MNSARLYTGRMNEQGVILRLNAGQVAGTRQCETECFADIPYAAPPVGTRRFGLPQAPPPWQGVWQPAVAGANAPQRTSEVPGLAIEPLIGKGWAPGEDYLTLNVWRPAGGGEQLPVMVWIHGGGFVAGSKDAPVSNGSSFARSGVICVAINYRMGIDGFLPIPGIPTNLGLRDMLAALQWVQDNIAEFGGDQANVTVFGESAGAMAIADLVTSPLTEGLFRRAIIQSGHGAMVREIPVARRLVRKLARLLKVSPDADGFASVDPEAVFDAIEKLARPGKIDLRDADGFEPVFGISRFIPVWGDDVLPERPLAALRKGAGADIDILIGSNSEEMNLYFVPTGVRSKIGRLFARWFVSRSMRRAGKLLKTYGMGTRGKRAGDAMTEALSDCIFRWPVRQFAAAHRGRTHVYEFEWRSPAFGGELGACHALDVPFVFDTLATATGPEGLAGEAPPQDFAERIHALWVGFAKDGSLPWPEFDAETRQVYQLAQGEAVREAVMPAAQFLPS